MSVNASVNLIGMIKVRNNNNHRNNTGIII